MSLTCLQSRESILLLNYPPYPDPAGPRARLARSEKDMSYCTREGNVAGLTWFQYFNPTETVILCKRSEHPGSRHGKSAPLPESNDWCKVQSSDPSSSHVLWKDLEELDTSLELLSLFHRKKRYSSFNIHWCFGACCHIIWGKMSQWNLTLSFLMHSKLLTPFAFLGQFDLVEHELINHSNLLINA